MKTLLLYCLMPLVTLNLFAEPVKIKLTDNSSDCVNPAISVDTFGNAHIVWQDNRYGDWEIYYAKIDASGAILVNNINVSQSGAQSITPDISTDGDGNAYIVWIESDELYFAMLDNTGKKLVENTQVVGHTSAVPAISTLLDGTINITFEYRQTAKYNFYYAQIGFDGKIIDKAVKLADWDIIGEKRHVSDIDNDLAGNSYVFYRYRNTGLFPLDHAMFYAKIGPDRKVIGNSRIKNRPNANHPAVAVADPNLFLIYTDIRDGSSGIYDLLNPSDDIRVDIGGVNTDFPTVASDKTHNTYIAWSDERDGNQEIYLSHLNEDNDFVESNIRITETSGNSTQPDIDMDGEGNYYLVWQDETDGDWELWVSSMKYSNSLPDLEMFLVEGPRTTNSGYMIDVHVNFSNKGSSVFGNGKVKMKIVLSLDQVIDSNDDTIEEISFDNHRLTAGANIDEWYRIRLSTNVVGEYYIGAYIDADDACSELNEINNFNISKSCTIKEYEFDKWTFAHLTDIHIGYKGDKESYTIESENFGYTTPEIIYTLYGTRFSDALIEMLSFDQKPDFLLISGDNVEYAREDFFSQFMAYVNTYRNVYQIPVHITPGNHDRYERAPLVNSIEEFLNFGNEHLILYRKWVSDGDEPYYYSFKKKDRLFIGLDTGADYLDDFEKSDWPKWPLIGDMGPEGDGLSDIQKIKLEKEDYHIPKIVFTHHPVLTGSKDPDKSTGELNEDASFVKFHDDFFIPYCETSNVSLVLSGHTHLDRIIKKNDTQYVQTPSATKDKYPYSYGYRIISVSEKGAVNVNYYRTPPSADKNILFARGAVHLYAFDSQGRKTGYGGTNKLNAFDSQNRKIENSIITDIPHSFYTGYYSANSAQAIILYGAKDDYCYEITGIDTDTCSFGILCFNTLTQFANVPMTETSLDKIHFEQDSTLTYKTSDPTKPYSISLYQELDNQSRSFVVENTTIGKNDSSQFKIIDKNALSYCNNGARKNYDLRFIQMGADTTEVSYDNIQIAANETHVMGPTSWLSLATSDVKIDIDKNGDGIIDSTAIIQATTRIKQGNPLQQPDEFDLYQNYPNPFNAQTMIRYDIASSCHVKLAVYDLLGRKVRGLVNQHMEPGSHSSTWNGKNDAGEDLPSGMYIVTLQGSGETLNITKTMKMVLLR